MGRYAYLLLRPLRALAAGHTPNEPADAHLLERFTRHRDEGAFVALVERHGPMVLSVCRRALHDGHLAEDVFQATFLVLARNPGSVHTRTSLASWLHGVALRLARRAKTDAVRAGRGDPRSGPTAPPDPPTEASWREVRQILDDELQRLPERYRAPLILCLLEGRPREEAAAQLGWSPGRLKGILERGRERLRTALSRRGLAPAAVAPALLAEMVLAGPVPPLLVVAIVRVASRLVSGAALGACGVSEMVAATMSEFAVMNSKKPSLAMALALVVGVLGTTAGALALLTEPANTGGDPKRAADVPPVMQPPVPPDWGAAKKESPKDEKTPPTEPWRVKATLEAVAVSDESLQLGFRLSTTLLQFSPDGKKLVAARGTGIATFALIDLDTDKDLTDPAIRRGDDKIESRFVGFTEDGTPWGWREIPSGPTVAGYALVDWATGKERARVSEVARRAVLSPDGKVLAGIQGNEEIVLWDATTGKKRGTLGTRPDDRFGCLAFSPDSKSLATFGFPLHRYIPKPRDEYGHLSLWDVETLKEKSSRPFNDEKIDLGLNKGQQDRYESIRAMRFTPDGQRLAVTCWAVLPGQPYAQTVLRLWDVGGSKEAKQFDSVEHGSVVDYAFSPDGKTVAVVWFGALVKRGGSGEPNVHAPGPAVLLDSSTGRERARLPVPRAGFAAVAFSPDGKLLATQDNRGIVQVWDRSTAKEDQRPSKPPADRPRE